MISSKVTKPIGIITRSRQLFLTNTLCTSYNSLILPCLQYFSIVWAPTYPSHLPPTFRPQKKAPTIMSHSPPRTHTYPLFRTLNILNTNLILIVINILRGRKIIYISILINTLFFYGYTYRVPKFGMIFLSYDAIGKISMTSFVPVVGTFE